MTNKQCLACGHYSDNDTQICDACRKLAAEMDAPTVYSEPDFYLQAFWPGAVIRQFETKDPLWWMSSRKQSK